MRFMMMIKSDEQTEAGALPDEKLIEAMVRYNDELVNAGALLTAEGLHATSRGARIKFTNGKPVVTDGPFAEAKEVVAGYWIIQAKSKEEAIEWAKRVPLEAGDTGGSSGQGQIEVRPIYELTDFPVSENESGWRESEAEFRDRADPSGEFADARKPGYKRFVGFRMADKDTEAGVMPNEALMAAMGAYNEEMITSGVMLSGDGLKPSREGARVYYSKGKRTVVDGPFAETKELVAGFAVLQARSLDELIELMLRWPALDGDGNVELQVREVFESEDMGSGLTPELREAEERQRERIARQQKR